MTLQTLLLWVLICMSVLAAGLTVYDKIAAKTEGARRIPENTLMYVGFMGGAAAMYLTMLLIRHKTLHKKFMIGLPVFIALHAAIAAILILKVF